MSRQLQAMEEELQEKASDLASTVGRLEEQTALCDEAKRELSTERTERVAVEERLQKTEAELQEVRLTTYDEELVMARVEEADRKVSDLEEALKRALSEKAQLLEENVVLGERIGAFEEASAGEEALVSQLNEAKAQLQSLQADNLRQVERMEELSASKKALADDIWKQEVCLKEAQEGRHKAETALHKAEAELTSSRAQVEEVSARAADGLDALEDSKKRCEELERALREGSAAGDGRQQELSQECSRLREAIAEMEGQLTEAIRLSEEKSEEMKSLKKTIDTLREAVHHGEGEKEAGLLLAFFSETALKKSIDEVRSVVEGKVSALATLENQIGKLKSKLAEEDVLQRELCKELEEARQEIGLLKGQAEIDAALREEVAGLQEEADAAREHIADLNRQLKEAQDEISRLTEALRELEGSMEARAASSDELIIEQREIHAATVQKLEEDKRATEVIVKERGMEIARLEELLKSAEDASEDLKGSVENLQRRLSEATEREAANAAKLVASRDECEALQRSLAELEVSKERLAEEARHGAEMEEKYNLQLKASEELLAEREREVEEREASLAEVKKEHCPEREDFTHDEAAPEYVPDCFADLAIRGCDLLFRGEHQSDIDVQLRIAETEHELLVKLEETEKDLADEKTATSALTNRIRKLEKRESELLQQLEAQKVTGTLVLFAEWRPVSRAEFDERAAQVDQLVEERKALMARIEDIETAGLGASQPTAGPPMPVVREGEESAKVRRASDPTKSRASLHSLGFFSANLSSNLALSPDGMGIEYDCGTAAKDEAMCAVVMTDRPLPYDTSFGYYFEITILAGAGESTEYSDGLTLGVTTTRPEEVRGGSDAPSSCDEIPETWAVGFDGQVWDPILNDWSACNWCGKDLKEGQKVGLLVSKSPVDQLFILVDGAVVAEGPRNIPTGRPLYGVVDLIGSTNAVALSDPETTPLPPAALQLVPKSFVMSDGCFRPTGCAIFLGSIGERPHRLQASLSSNKNNVRRSRNESKKGTSSSVAGGSVAGDKVAFEMPSFHGSQSFLAPSVSSVGSKFALPSRKAASKHQSSSAHSSAGSTSSKLAFPKFNRR
ncbi:3-dehydrosphinganine reductase [Perkinsus olseni]|uniref:3-dehydrosphinganine reductase n=1 Tax=Perkinsus olseni TaxID=32597 RepID=A0A7J6UD39_PEROL|nr:3-dehydrosphinganine reductase [Perkinsus olseni]